MNIRATALGLMTLGFAGCQREAVTSYTIPKEDYSVRVAAAPADSHAEHSRPHVHWELPKGWEEIKTDRMSVGRFRIAGPDGKTAEAKIVPLPGKEMAQMESEVVKMWAGELNLPETTAAKTSEIEAAGLKGKLYDLSSSESRMLTAVLHGNTETWFVKFSGPAAIVSSHESAFKDFLKTLDIHEESHEEAPPAVQAKWPGAEGWTAVAPGSMVLAAYSVNGKANVTVSSFPGDVGGMLANVNRWRGQIGLGPIPESELSNLTKPMTLSDGTKATAVELKSDSKTSYTIVAMREGNSWFYKILGDAETVSAQKGNLAEYAARAK